MTTLFPPCFVVQALVQRKKMPLSVKLPAICLHLTKSELCHRFLSRESSMQITKKHTNRFENILWEEKQDFLRTSRRNN